MKLIYALLIYFAQVLRRLGAREPVESAIMLVTVIEGCLVLLGMSIVKLRTGYIIGKTPFVVFAAALFALNHWLLGRRVRRLVRENAYEEPVNWLDALLALLLWLALTLGVLWLMVPLAAWLQPR
jgi:vacuolar-type H+-ATPase subunit I/STV1